ncbi:MAG: hypothetical protein WBD55_04550 [Dehalococcoidia bacterium]
MRVFFIVLSGLTLLGLALIIGCAVMLDRILSGIGSELLDDDVFVVAGLLQPLSKATKEHDAFACADVDRVLVGRWRPRELASALGRPEGAWTVAEQGKLRGIPYVVVANIESEPSRVDGANGRLAELPSGRLVCMVPSGSSPSTTP